MYENLGHVRDGNICKHKPNCLDFLLESVKKPIEIGHKLLMRTRTVQWVVLQLSKVSLTNWGFLMMKHHLLYKIVFGFYIFNFKVIKYKSANFSGIANNAFMMKVKNYRSLASFARLH